MVEIAEVSPQEEETQATTTATQGPGHYELNFEPVKFDYIQPKGEVTVLQSTMYKMAEVSKENGTKRKATLLSSPSGAQKVYPNKGSALCYVHATKRLNSTSCWINPLFG